MPRLWSALGERAAEGADPRLRPKLPEEIIPDEERARAIFRWISISGRLSHGAEC